MCLLVTPIVFSEECMMVAYLYDTDTASQM